VLDGRRLYLAVKWPSEAPIVAGFVEGNYDVPVPPPAGSQHSCDRVEGLLLAYLAPAGATADPARDELVGVSYKGLGLFPYQQAAYDQRFAWDGCARSSEQRMPLILMHEPRLPLALCERDCGSGLDRTRIYAMSSGAEPGGRVYLSPHFVHVPAGETVTFVVNGREVPSSVGQVGADLGASSPFRAGPNAVSIRVGSLPAWKATLVLPAGELAPRLLGPGLRQGENFSARWSASPWASGYQVLLNPADPVARVGSLEFFSTQASLEARYEGWGTLDNRKVRLGVRTGWSSDAGSGVPHGSSGYGFIWSQWITVDVLR
jgi:hypothetical protein